METTAEQRVLSNTIGQPEIIKKILGSTAAYLDESIGTWTEARIKNVRRIFEYTQKRLGPKLEEPGSVPPKILKGILHEGSYCNDELSAAYLGGILASSRGEIVRDDRGAGLIALVGRLSTYQIRTHHLFYRTLKQLFDGREYTVLSSEGRDRLQTFVPFGDFVAAMGFTLKENAGVIVQHTMFGLIREGLIGPAGYWGQNDFVKKYDQSLDMSGIVYSPSPLGVELLLWALGDGYIPVENFLRTSVSFPDDLAMPTLSGARPVGVHQARPAPNAP